eukprot:Seg15642.1 transcript_id=Seg15642.1/GoldUCD/mRNA.D3Y31 product="hypothetical protein" pseudo=true protein_id=Seg15642.1/GoldUCD/D3Y31
MIKKICSAIGVSTVLTTSSFGATTLTVGDISFVGYSADGVDEFAFITWVDLDASTTINFTDRGWRADQSGFTKNPSENPANSGLVPSDGNVVWTSSTAISAGTVVVGTLSTTDPHTVSWSLGVSTGDFGFTGFSGAGDSIFAYQGTNASPEFVAGIYFRDSTWGTAGEYETSVSSLPNALNVTGGNIVPVNGTSPNDNGRYTGPTTGLTSLAEYKSRILDKNNWTISNTDASDNLTSDLGFSSVTVAPEPSSALLISVASLFGLTLRRRK